MAKELNSQVEVRVRLLTKASFVNALCMRQSNFLCLLTFFKLNSSYCQRRLQSEGPLVRSYRTVRLKTRSKILRLMSFNWKRSCQHRLSPTSPLWNHPPPSSSFSAFLEPVVLTIFLSHSQFSDLSLFLTSMNFHSCFLQHHHCI